MKATSICGISSLLLCLLLSCGKSELTEDERFDLYIKTLSNDSTGYRIVYETAKNIDTLYGVFNMSLEFVPLKQQLDYYDSLTILYITKRDSTFERKYVPSRDKKKSTYINWNRFNDSAKAYLSKGDSVRANIQRKAIKHEKTVKGYVVDFSVLLIGEEDTVLVRQFDIWLKEDFPISYIKHEKTEVFK